MYDVLYINFNESYTKVTASSKARDACPKKHLIFACGLVARRDIHSKSSV